MTYHDIVIIGAGPAGLAAAIGAREAGVEDILLLERDNAPGGILNQCIHNGFGLHTFNEELTGPEYAQRFIDRVEELGIPIQLGTMVLDISPDRVLTCTSRENGLEEIRAGAVILCMGCRERPRGAMDIPGSRPAGIYSAGTAQRLVNVEGFMPGKEVFIMGSGDVGLIMARRKTLEGAVVKGVCNRSSYSSGLKRNVVQCLDDFGIPLMVRHTVTEIHGRERLEGVTVSEVGEDKKPIPGTGQFIKCDTLLFSVGLVPENELSEQAGVELDEVTGGPVVTEQLATSIPGVFACGSVLHVTTWWTTSPRRRSGPGRPPPGSCAARPCPAGASWRSGAKTACATACRRAWIWPRCPRRSRSASGSATSIWTTICPAMWTGSAWPIRKSRS